VTQRTPRQTRSDDPVHWSYLRATTCTDERSTHATALRDLPDQEERSRQQGGRGQRTVERGQQWGGSAVAPDKEQRGGLDTGRSTQALEQRDRQRADTTRPQRNPPAFGDDGADSHAQTCPGEDAFRRRDSHADDATLLRHREDGRLAAYVAEIVDSAPPLTDAQRDRIAGVLQAAISEVL